MKCLSIRQPWCHFITRPDVTDPATRAELLERGFIKPVENRDWATKIRGPLLAGHVESVGNLWADGCNSGFARATNVSAAAVTGQLIIDIARKADSPAGG